MLALKMFFNIKQTTNNGRETRCTLLISNHGIVSEGESDCLWPLYYHLRAEVDRINKK